MTDIADAIVVGAGLAGLVAAAELGDRGKQVIVVDQEGPQNLGGQAHWSLGGLFMVDTPEQRRMGIRDSRGLALSDWMGSAQFDRDEDALPRQWAEAYVDFAAGEMRSWLHQMGLRWFPVVGWAERGGGFADGHGNSVPRFHITWGTGPGVLEHFIRRCKEHAAAGRITFRFRHQVDRIEMENGAATGVSGTVLAEDAAPIGARTNRDPAGEFRIHAPAVLVTSGGIGGNFEMVRKVWPVDRLGQPPKENGGRGPGPCGRAHDRDFRSRRRTGHQWRPDVALYGRGQELGPDLACPRHTHPAGTVVDVV